jgi:hypothetical protein
MVAIYRAWVGKPFVGVIETEERAKMLLWEMYKKKHPNGATLTEFYENKIWKRCGYIIDEVPLFENCKDVKNLLNKG